MPCSGGDDHPPVGGDAGARGLDQRALVFRCGDAGLVGILHIPAAEAECGVVIVVGGPQYRVGSHRQFVLLARRLAEAGYPVLRFDHRGIGDSDGTFAGFEAIGDDIRAAIDCLMAELPSVTRVALWGLCDAASAIAFYAADDPRVSSIVVVNPWVRTETGLAGVHLRHYYWRRLRSGDLWRRALAGRVDVRGAAATVAVVAGAVGRRFLGRRRRPVVAGDDAGPPPSATPASLPARVAAGLQRFRGRVLVVLSTADLTAREFEDSVLGSRPMRRWRRRPQVTIRHLVGANHTCSTAASRRQLHEWVVAWLDAGGAA